MLIVSSFLKISISLAYKWQMFVHVSYTMVTLEHGRITRYAHMVVLYAMLTWSYYMLCSHGRITLPSHTKIGQ